MQLLKHRLCMEDHDHPPGNIEHPLTRFFSFSPRQGPLKTTLGNFLRLKLSLQRREIAALLAHVAFAEDMQVPPISGALVRFRAVGARKWLFAALPCESVACSLETLHLLLPGTPQQWCPDRRVAGAGLHKHSFATWFDRARRNRS